jgi:NADH-quinone oxidoreductase subunit L
MDLHTREHLHETPWVVTVPLILLAIPSVVAGALTIEPLLFGEFFRGAIQVAPEHDVFRAVGEHFHGPLEFALHGLLAPAFWLVVAGATSAWFIYMRRPELADMLRRQFSGAYALLERKYGFDDFYQAFFAGGSRKLGRGLWKFGDAGLIDGVLVNGTASSIGWFAGVFRRVQSGYLYHYAFAMILGLLGLLTWIIVR